MVDPRGPADAGERPVPMVPLAKGFRLFFLFGAAYATLIVPLWLLVLRGRVAVDIGVPSPQWHAHEMVYGFALAFIAGFLLTAVSNWTKRETVTGARLAIVVVAWLAGRFVFLPGMDVGAPIRALVDLAFLPMVFVAITRPLVAARSKRNYGFPIIVAGLWLLDLAFHLDAMGVASVGVGFDANGLAAPAMRAGLDLVLVVIAIIAGRIIPMFTRNATGNTGILRRRWADLAMIWALVGLTVLDFFGAPAGLVAPVAAAGGVFAVIRSVGWGIRSTLRVPLLWVLHVGHAWLAIGLLLRAFSSWGPALMPMAANHALGLGGVGTLTLAMMARVALGHTGRPLKAPPAVSVAFVLVVLAGLVRVVTPLVAASAYLTSIEVAGALWTLAFGLYLVRYASILLSRRADGRPG